MNEEYICVGRLSFEYKCQIKKNINNNEYFYSSGYKPYL